MEHPIMPPPELVAQWSTAALGAEDWLGGYNLELIATAAARWGADQELEACCEWLRGAAPAWERQLRAARRPKPPSLKEEALAALGADGYSMLAGKRFEPVQLEIIRRALEQLND